MTGTDVGYKKGVVRMKVVQGNLGRYLFLGQGTNTLVVDCQSLGSVHSFQSFMFHCNNFPMHIYIFCSVVETIQGRDLSCDTQDTLTSP